MSLSSMIKIGSGAIRGASNATTRGLARGAVGSLGAVGTAFSVYGSYREHRDDYGAGGSALIGLAEAMFFTALPGPLSIGLGLAYMGGKAAFQHGKETYRQNRRMSLGEQSLDLFGTQATMRARSRETLSRGRQTLSHEARLFHR